MGNKKIAAIDLKNNENFKSIVNQNVKDVIYSLPEPEYREVLQKAGNHHNLESIFNFLISSVLVKYVNENNLDINDIDWNELNINILELINNLNKEKSVMDTLENAVDHMDTIDSIDEFLAKISGDEDETVIFDLIDELLDS